MTPVVFLAIGAAGLLALALSSADEKPSDKDRKVGPEKVPARQFKFGGAMPFHFATVRYEDRARQKTRYPVVWGDRIETWRARDKSANGESEFTLGPQVVSALSVFDPAGEGRYPFPSASEVRELELELATNPQDRILIVDQFGALVGELTRAPSGVWSVSIPLSDSTTFQQPAR